MRRRGLLRLSLLAPLLAACGPAAPGPSATSGGAPSATAPAAATTRPSPAAASTKPTPDLGRARFSTAGWKTDFSKASVGYDEIASGGPPRDGIPPIDRPAFVTIAEADAWLNAQEPVVHLALGSAARAYPLQILIWHEIVNDTLDGQPVAVTFCPLCNTAIAFDRRLGGQVLDFGTTGNLRNSDLVMWDRQTESWWQQITGEAIVGELTGARLTMLPATIIAWATFKQQHPDGQVLSRDTGHSRSYGRNPYVGYDDVNQSPFLFAGKTDERLRPMERVVTVSLGGEDVAYPFSLMAERRVLHDTVGGLPIVVFYEPGTRSALDGSAIAQSREIGATAVFQPRIDGQSLTFAWQSDAPVDAETKSRWTLLGQATAGPLRGKQLPAVVSGNHFWFAWAVFKPSTRVAK